MHYDRGTLGGCAERGRQPEVLQPDVRRIDLGNGPGILAAVEALSPKVAEVIDAAATAGQKAQEVIASDPALETLLRAELVKLLPPGVKPGKKTKAELIAIIRAARKGNA